MSLWRRVKKCDFRAWTLADGHYTRQTPGAAQWTRPGYNFVLYHESAFVRAVWCWWRPKWEAGIERKDGLRVVECTMFRRVGAADDQPRSSTLVAAAVGALLRPVAVTDLELDTAGPVECLLTGVDSEKTTGGRSPWHKPGRCYRAAGWQEYDKQGGRADVWLSRPWPRDAVPPRRQGLLWTAGGDT